MSVEPTAEQRLRDGDVVGALARLEEQVRLRADDPGLRIFLFQLLCVAGQWKRALDQLGVAVSLDPEALPMAETYGAAVRGELVREDVFDGGTSPMLFGDAEPWLAQLVESLKLAGLGEHAASERLRLRAFDEAPMSSGEVDGRPFQWVADADSRLGPVLEAMIGGRYGWIPFSRVSRIAIERPANLRDVVWIPAHLVFDNGDESAALIPARYPGSEAALDRTVVLARKTVWIETAPDAYHGLGQRVIATDADEHPLLEIRTIVMADPPRGDVLESAVHA